MSENTREELLQGLAERSSTLEPELLDFYLVFLEQLAKHQADQWQSQGFQAST